MTNEWASKKCTACENLVYYKPTWSIKPRKCARCRLTGIGDIGFLLSNYLKLEEDLRKKIRDPEDIRLFNGRATLRLKISSLLTTELGGASSLVELIMKDKELEKLVFRLHKESSIKDNNQSAKSLPSGYVQVFQGGSPGLGRRK